MLLRSTAEGCDPAATRGIGAGLEPLLVAVGLVTGQ